MANGETARPTYAGAFRCIGPACEDDCCHGWDIPVDKTTYQRYTLFPADRLGWAVAGFVSVSPSNVPDSLYAQIHMAASGECPFFESDRLCGIQKAYGAELLSASCSSYPRALNRVDGMLEGSLSLSCPEAARNVLLDPGFLERVTDLEAGGFRTDNFLTPGKAGTRWMANPLEAFHAVRAAIVGMVKDRTRPLWLRLLRIGLLCQRLERGGDAPAAIAEVLGSDIDPRLSEFGADRGARLAVAMRLSDERVRDETRGRRFQETYWSFVEGIASDAGDDLVQLDRADRLYYRPFMRAHPHVLENFVLNYVYQRLFPFGRAGGATRSERGMFEEFVLLATQFGWMETLLMGIAGRDRENFGEARVVETVQSFHREVEHYPAVLEGILAAMRDRGMDTLAGMSGLLR